MIRLIFLLLVASLGCVEQPATSDQQTNLVVADTAPAPRSLIDSTGTTIASRFLPPDGFERMAADSTEFAFFLQHLPLKAPGAQVRTFDDRIKPDRNVYHAVVDLPIGSRDLHQCADAVMRLRAEYLYQQQAFDQIHFNFTNGFRADYSRWRRGERIAVNGNRVSWVPGGSASTSRESFWKYLEMVFSYAGTLSLAQELTPVAVSELRIGDVFIRGGSPGHAVIVVDMAVDPASGRKVFMLAQSYMPAQEIQVLRNPANADLSPWYDIPTGAVLNTPEWRFEVGELKQF